MSIQQSKVENNIQGGRERAFALSSFPVDMSSFLILPHCTFDAAGVPSHVNPAGYHPGTIVHYALAHWNQYLATNADSHRKTFLAQASWLVEHEMRIGEDAGGWPISFPHPDVPIRGPWLSALTQGSAVSVLLRAYQLTREEVFLAVVDRAARTFERDILDGGVSAPVGADGVFFEEVAVYPAAHLLTGSVFALIGLYDYVAYTGDAQVEKLIHRGLATMHNFLDEFDVGFWTRSGLLHRQLASPAQLALQARLLEALATCSGCEHCLRLASRWKSYQHRLGFRLRYLISSHCALLGSTLLRRMRSILFHKSQVSPVLRVCVPVTAHPVTGGILSFLSTIVQVTSGRWQLEYLTHRIGPHADGLVIHTFGARRMSPWHFPTVWLYCFAGLRKLISLMRRGAGYQVLLPQDGVFTAAFSGLAGKLAGVRVVCVDHGPMTWFTSRVYPRYRAERLDNLTKRHWHWTIRLLARLLFGLYRPSLYLLARISACVVDHFLVPGVAGDGVEEICQRLGIQQSRLTRFATMIDVDRHIVPSPALKAMMREKKGLAGDDIVIAIVCRLAPEKGLDIALESINQSLVALSPELRVRVRVVIAGDGPLRRELEEEIRKRGLSQTYLFWGEISPEEVVSLLGLSDIFLYTSTRGACFAMAVLEAMASSCAVVASTAPISNAHLLAEGRGIAVAPGDAEQTALALVRLVSDLELCRRMGDLARAYLVVHHSAVTFKRTLLRATYGSALDGFLHDGKQSERH